MTVSEITVNNIAGYLRLDSTLDQTTTAQLTAILTAAKQFISSYTGIPVTSTDATAETLDSHEDFYIVTMILCRDMYDNRVMYVEKNNINKVVDTILGMHCRNLI